MTAENDTKPPLSLMLDFPKAFAEISRGLEHGIPEYGKWNWKNCRSKITDRENSLMRHIVSFHNCEDIDPGTGVNNMALAIANALFILENYLEHGEKVDDRDHKKYEI